MVTGMTGIFNTLYIFVSYKTYTVSQARYASIFMWNREN